MFEKIRTGINSLINKIKIKELTDNEIEPYLEQLKELLVRNEVARVTAEEIKLELKNQLLELEYERFRDVEPLVRVSLENVIKDILMEPLSKFNLNELIKDIEEKRINNEPYIICVIGINGTGKTTTIAKLTKYFQNKGYDVVLSASDTYRAGSIQQIQKHADNLNTKLIAQNYGSDPAAVAIDAIDHAESNNKDIVIIDTAGRMQNNVNLVRELEKIIRLTEPHLKLFIGDALAGNDVIQQADKFNAEIDLDGIIMTKLDSDIKGGAVISIANVIKKPILFLGVGQSYDDLIEFEPNKIMEQVLGK
jgi:fused signal recognition particle receptor